MDTDTQIDMTLTLGELAELLGVKLHEVKYAVLSRAIQAASRRGRLRLFDANAALETAQAIEEVRANTDRNPLDWQAIAKSAEEVAPGFAPVALHIAGLGAIGTPEGRAKLQAGMEKLTGHTPQEIRKIQAGMRRTVGMAATQGADHV